MLQAGCAPDALELWSVSEAAELHFNLVQQGQVRLSRKTGINRDDFTLMLLEDGFVYCDRVDSEPSNTPSQDTPLLEDPVHAIGLHPLNRLICLSPGVSLHVQGAERCNHAGTFKEVRNI